MGLELFSPPESPPRRAFCFYGLYRSDTSKPFHEPSLRIHSSLVAGISAAGSLVMTSRHG